MKSVLILLCSLFLVAPAWAADAGEGEASKTTPDLDELNASLRTFSEGLFLKKSAQVAQAEVEAQTRSEFGMELRPNVTEDDAGVALRIYLPSRWQQGRLRDQLELVAQSEALRIAALEWEELLSVYRDFCTYRMLQKQIVLYTDELSFLEPILEQADGLVQQNQFAVSDRARLYSLYLDLLNNRENQALARVELELSLHRALGSHADLDAFAPIARLELPTDLNLEELMDYAVTHRADYQQLDVDAQALEAAEDLARSEDGFRFKYIQPAYSADYKGGEDNWGVSAAFVLPWGSQNPDIAEYRQQRELADFEMALQRRIMKDRLQTLQQASTALQTQLDRRNRLMQPLLTQLTNDLAQMDTDHLEEVRDRLQIREQVLSASLQTTLEECKREQLAIDFAEELGSLEP